MATLAVLANRSVFIEQRTPLVLVALVALAVAALITGDVIVLLEVEEICAITGMTRDAVYAWRSRLKRILVSLVELPGDEPRVGIMRLANNGSEEP